MLSTTAEYAIRALVYLAKVYPDESALGRDISQNADIPGNYLAKILVALNKAKIVEATRGPGGGYRLHRPPEEITLFDVVAVIDSEDTVPVCLLRRGMLCKEDNPCAAHKAWANVLNTYYDFLKKTTIKTISLHNPIEDERMEQFTSSGE